MGTRGLVGFVHNGVEKLSYNHFDSYPDALGVATLEWLKSVLTDDAALDPEIIAKVDLLVLVDENASPTPEERAALVRFANPNVSTGEDWYSLLRECQGELGKILEAGIITDSHAFALDSLFCEWAYIVDIDAGNLDVYTGFQQKVPTAGRWAGIAGEASYDGGPVYHPISLLWSIPFAEVAAMTPEEFVAAVEVRAEVLEEAAS